MRFTEFRIKEDYEDHAWDDLIGTGITSMFSGGKATGLLKPLSKLSGIFGSDEKSSKNSKVGSKTTSNSRSTSSTVPPSNTNIQTDRKTNASSISVSGRPSEQLINFIKQKETFSPWAKLDYKQYSNGYGTKARSRNEVIDEREADRRLRQQVQEFYNIVVQFDRTHKYGFNNNQLNALTSFVYNGGPGWLDQVSDNGRRSKQQIAQSMLTFNTAGGQRLGGLVQRRREEVAMFNASSNIA